MRQVLVVVSLLLVAGTHPLRAQRSDSLSLRPFVPTTLPLQGVLQCDSAATALAWTGVDSMDPGTGTAIDPPRPLKVGHGSLPRDLEETGGRLIADFVVDSTGEIRSCSFRVVATTDSRLVPVALAILTEARFAPGQAQGRPVSASVRQTIRFPRVRRLED